jgi:CheY-like chemotaxis protein
MLPLILIVADDAAARLFAAEILEEAGYPILEAATASDALTMLERNPSVSLLITDLQRPGTNDFVLGDMAVTCWPDLRVLYTTGLSHLQEADAQAGCLHGRVLAKPYRKAELTAAVRATLLHRNPDQKRSSELQPRSQSSLGGLL